MHYHAIDVETANADQASICQIGIATFHHGELIDTWSSYIDPCDYFDPFNIAIHGIDERRVAGAPTFEAIYSELRERLQGSIVAHHMPFDRNAIQRATSRTRNGYIEASWLDTATVTRRAWSQFSKSGYGLANICNYLNIELTQHHDALADAIAAGHVLAHACRHSSTSPEQWLTAVMAHSRSSSSSSSDISLEGNPDGPLYGHRIVFTGALSLVREDAARLAAKAGCQVDKSVTQKTTLLVVGTQYLTNKSTKHIKAESLIQKGFPIQIITEDDFMSFVE